MPNVLRPRRSALILASLMLLPALRLTPPVGAQCSTTCGPGGGGVSCTVALTQSPCVALGDYLCTAYPPSETMVMTTVFNSTNATCLPGGSGDSSAMALHIAGQGLPAECVFRFRVARCSSGINCTAAAPNTVTCTVNDAGDGLPVELMEFSVEEDDEDSSSDG